MMSDSVEHLLSLRGKLHELETELGDLLTLIAAPSPSIRNLSRTARCLLEKTLLRACEVHQVETGRKASVEKLKTALTSSGQVDDRVRTHIGMVQGLGNIGAHTQTQAVTLTIRDAESVLHSLAIILAWYQQSAVTSDASIWRELAQRVDLRSDDKRAGYAQLQGLGPTSKPPLWVLQSLGLDFSPAEAYPMLCEALSLEGTEPAAPGPRECRNGRLCGYELAGSDGKAIAVLHGLGDLYGRVFVVRRGIGWYYKQRAGGTTGWLGFPLSNEYRNAEGARSDFENGHVQYHLRENVARVYRERAGVYELVEEHAFSRIMKLIREAVGSSVTPAESEG